MAKRTHKASGEKRGRAKPGRDSGGPVAVTALTVRELADLLGVPVATVREHVKAGAPCVAGRPRRLSLIEYAAWLNRAMPRRSQATPWRSREVRTRVEAAR